MLAQTDININININNISEIKEQIKKNKNYINYLYTKCEKQQFYGLCKEIIQEYPICISALQKFINNDLIIDENYNVSEEPINGYQQKTLKIDSTILNQLIEKNGEIATLINQNIIDKNIIKHAISGDPDNLLYYKLNINKEDYFELAMLAVKKNGMIIYNIETENLSDDEKIIIASEAIKQNSKAIKLIRQIFPKPFAEHIIEINTTVYVNHIDVCIICDDNKAELITQCNHQYCAICINEWLSCGSGCPYCRKDLSKESLKKIILRM